MKIRSINKRNISILQTAFLDYLLDNMVPFDNISLVEGEEENQDKFLLVFQNGNELSVCKFDKEMCIGFEHAEIAKMVLDPVLPCLLGQEVDEEQPPSNTLH